MDINAINHAKTMYVSLHDLCGVIKDISVPFATILLAIMCFIYLVNIDEDESIKKNCFKYIKILSIHVIILSILIILSVIIPHFYKIQLIVSGMSIEQISKLVGK